MNYELESKVRHLLELKQEGTWWDFKKEWYSNTPEKKADLLHDIICMANNVSGKNGLIIIGVENSTYNLVGVSNDPNSKTTQNLVDFLRDKKFNGDVYPTVWVETIFLKTTPLDIILIQSDRNVPYVLKEKYQKVNPHNVYIRVQDTNTPTNRSANYTDQEKLWKRHFGLDLNPLARVTLYMDDVNNWTKSETGHLFPIRYYYNDFPEFIFECEVDTELTGYEAYLSNQSDKRPHFGSFNLYYHQTLLSSYQTVSLDGGRATVPVPDQIFTNIPMESNNPYGLHYRLQFYEIGSTRWSIFQNVLRDPRESDEIDARRKLLELILVFNSRTERLEFTEYLSHIFNKSELEKYPKAFLREVVEIEDKVQQEYKFLRYCHDKLKEFRKKNNYITPICY